jgi:multidrug resistance efflux pump
MKTFDQIEIDRLKQELAAHKARQSSLQQDFAALQKAIIGGTGKSAILELDKLKRDADRYRFLRTNPQLMGWDAYRSPERVDDFVDTARITFARRIRN